MKINKKQAMVIVGVLLIGILLGALLFGRDSAAETPSRETVAETRVWTCSMHPQIRQSEPGKCPICGMDLIPLQEEMSSENPMAVQMSETAVKLANIQTVRVGNRKANKEIRLNGKIQVDERNRYAQATHIPGRIEKLLVNFTGESIRKGQTLAVLYSPELVTAQQELLQAYDMRETQPDLFEAAKQKLIYLKISKSQIERIIRNKKPMERFPITADVNGVVTEKKVDLGDYVERGSPIYEISDLSRIWVLFDIYESDMKWVKTGSHIRYTVSSLPGEEFEGVITFIDPMIDPRTRVATARVELKNTDNRLKPEMFVSGVVKTSASDNDEIVVPKSAVMWTGERSIVYVKSQTASKMNFQLREIVLGPSLGDSFTVVSGLEPGEEIVTHGTFTVDAAAQLAGKPSMMNPQGHESGASSHVHEAHKLQTDVQTPVTLPDAARRKVNKVVALYLDINDALAADNFLKAKKVFNELDQVLKTGDGKAFNSYINTWEGYSKQAVQQTTKALKADKLEAIRDDLDELSAVVIQMIKTFGPYSSELYVHHCPMVNNNSGADWLSLTREIKNPYFGSKMLGCGEVKTKI